MTREAKIAILQWLAWWKSKGLSRIPAKNMAVAELHILGSCKRLHAVGSLPDDIVMDVLEGLTICSCGEFKSMFDTCLQMFKLGNFSVIDGITSSSMPIEMIEAMLRKAVDYYFELADNVLWNIQN